MRVATVAAAVIVVLMGSGCANEQSAVTPSRGIALPTQSELPVGETPPACAAALIRGRLVADERWGIALVEEDSELLRQVIWPPGFYARVDGPNLALLSDSDEVVASTGDRVEIGGGEAGPDGAWRVCGSDVVVNG